MTPSENTVEASTVSCRLIISIALLRPLTITNVKFISHQKYSTIRSKNHDLRLLAQHQLVVFHHEGKTPDKVSHQPYSGVLGEKQ
jgi:hypothetical protein